MLAHEGTYPVLYGSWPIPVGAAHRNGYIARPDEAGKVPVVFVVPDLDGMGSFEKDLCRRLAREGFAALTIDIYGTKGEPLDLYNSLTDDRALSVLDELQQFVTSDDVDWNVEDHVGILGVDVGGRFGLIKAATRDWARSLALCYTPLTGDEEREHQVSDYLDHLPVPVLGLYGAEDDLIDPATVDEAQRRNDHGQWLLYEGVGHGFLDIDGEGFDQSAADDALARLFTFFKASLAQAEIEDLG
ncbi:MAG TPA: dienelactone hydrolase family protein [Acidimicrobiia bacterium]|nr:dienelactone hydrolase family protein [Acidimicrobiia bacterium]